MKRLSAVIVFSLLLALLVGEGWCPPALPRTSFQDAGGVVAHPYKVIHDCTQTVNADGTITLVCAGTGDIASIGNCTTGACDGTTMTWGNGTGPVVWTFAVTGADVVFTMTAGNLALTGSLNGITLAGGTNTFSMTNGTASLDVAAGATVNIDKSLTIDTGAVRIIGNVDNTSVLTLPSGATTFATYTEGAANSLLKDTGAAATGAAGITEDGTDINAAALNLVTTGAITGKVLVLTTGTGFTIGSSPLTVVTDRVAYGGAIYLTTTATLVLPPVVAGMSLCIKSPAAVVITVDPNGNDGIRNYTAARNADGHNISCDATAGNYVCLLGDSADGWDVLGYKGTWTDE